MSAIGFGARLSLGVLRGGGAAFEFAGALPAGATLSRGSPGTRHDAAGALVTEPANVARFDHDPVTLAPRGLLVEEARTNLYLHSGDLSQPAWNATGVANLPAALIEDASSGAHRQRANSTNAITFTAGQPACLSAVAGERAGSAKRYLVIRVSVSGIFTALPAAVYDLATGTVTAASSGVTAGCAAAGGGRWLCWWSAVPAATQAGTTDLLLSDAPGNLNPSYTGDGASGIEVVHAQIEGGAAPSTRIVTSGAAATRAADQLVLGWGSRGVPDGAATVRYTFDDGTTQDVAATIAGGSAAVPTNLARRRLRRAALA